MEIQHIENGKKCNFIQKKCNEKSINEAFSTTQQKRICEPNGPEALTLKQKYTETLSKLFHGLLTQNK